MGAEFDAEITVDADGNPMADGGICTTLRDLARFGQLLANKGRRQGIP
jgi:CubicO group peptidase (beta-lactamase class C family)